MSREVLSVSPAAAGEFLTGAGEFLPPARLPEDLTDEQAMTVPTGSVYSIVLVVAHMHYWQERNILQARGIEYARPDYLDHTFPKPQNGEWEALRAAFLAGLEECVQVVVESGNEAGIAQNGSTIGYDLAACPALYSAFHYGQIAVLRQIQGLWPPVGGDNSW